MLNGKPKRVFVSSAVMVFSMMLIGLPAGRFYWRSTEEVLGASNHEAAVTEADVTTDVLAEETIPVDAEVDVEETTPEVAVPNEGVIQIVGLQTQAVYDGPAGAVIAGLRLPKDVDHSGYDTYIVTGTQVVNGRTWVSLFLGSEAWGWVPLDQVIPLSDHLKLAQQAAE